MTDQPPIPFVKGIPFLGSTFALLHNPLGFLRRLQTLYGDQRLVRIQLGRRTVTVLLKPEEAKYVLQEYVQ